LPLRSSPSSQAGIPDRWSCCLLAVWRRSAWVNTPLGLRDSEVLCRLCLSASSTRRSAFVPPRSCLRTCRDESGFGIAWTSLWDHLSRCCAVFLCRRCQKSPTSKQLISYRPRKQ
jgi:hypothetical protein